MFVHMHRLLHIRGTVTNLFRVLAFMFLVCLPWAPKSNPTIYISVNDISREVISALKTGDAQGLSSHLAAMIDLKIPGYDDTYSKQQATRILKDFFSRNKIRDFKLLKKGVETQESYYIFGTLETPTMTFRSYLLIKKSGSEEYIQQIKIEES